jgi:hypothetical protein
VSARFSTADGPFSNVVVSAIPALTVTARPSCSFCVKPTIERSRSAS